MPGHLLRVAIMGTRGIPANYGGFETFAEELSTRLAARGHSVTVYGRHAIFSKSVRGEYRGVTLISTPTIMHKYLETPLHALSSFIDLFRRKFDVVLLCNAANAPFAWIVKIRGLPLLINVDGVERRRSKWNCFGRLWYLLGERCSVLFATRIVSDAQVIADYYRERFSCNSSIIAYGADTKPLPPGPVLHKFGLSRDCYILYVSRLEPENNAKGVIQAYLASGMEMPLVVVGDAPYADEYKAELHALANKNVVFTGFQFGEAYRELRTNCCIYVQATEVGGTHPALVEAMAYGNCIVANRVPEHEEVLGDAGEYYDFNNFESLAVLLKSLISDPQTRNGMKVRAHARATERYSWDKITVQYEDLFHEVAKLGG